MKHIRVYEAKYQTYDDYAHSQWGTPEEIKNDVTLYVRKGLPIDDWKASEKFIKSVEDQSDPKKGIKFEITLKDGNKVQAFKKGSFQQHWELYLNGKKLPQLSDSNALYWALFDKLKPLDKYLQRINGHDWYYNYADDHKSYTAGRNAGQLLRELYADLSVGEKKKAYKEYLKHVPKDLKRTFNQFDGA